MTDRTPRAIIKGFLPGTQHLADDILHALGRAGYFVCRMPGGVHEGYCPTCGCEPFRGADGETAIKSEEP